MLKKAEQTENTAPPKKTTLFHFNPPPAQFPEPAHIKGFII